MIPAIPPIPPVSAALAPAAAPVDAAGAAGTGASSFSDVLGNALNSLDATQQTANNLSLQAATGNANIADVTIVSTQADLETQLVTAVRDKAVTAFNSIMGMQA
jgi:flagellar hook-basal body complex protein FliE